MAWSPDESDRVRELLKLGERLGYLTYEMLNEELPDDVIAPEGLTSFWLRLTVAVFV